MFTEIRQSGVEAETSRNMSPREVLVRALVEIPEYTKAAGAARLLDPLGKEPLTFSVEGYGYQVQSLEDGDRDTPSRFSMHVIRFRPGDKGKVEELGKVSVTGPKKSTPGSTESIAVSHGGRVFKGEANQGQLVVLSHGGRVFKGKTAQEQLGVAFPELFPKPVEPSLNEFIDSVVTPAVEPTALYIAGSQAQELQSVG